MPWVPITAQAHDEKRPEIAADGLRVPETGLVENVPKGGDLSDWVCNCSQGEIGEIIMNPRSSTIGKAFTLQRYTHHYDASARRTADAIGKILPDEF